MLASAVADLRLRIEKARLSSPLAAPEVVLVAASKAQAPDRLQAALKAGITDFGENRVQEALEKRELLKAGGAKLHLIGPLQTNKVRQALELFDVIHTVDREKLALAIAKELKNWGTEELEKKNPQFPNSPAPQFFIQVNTGEEPQKAGVYPKEADTLIRHCKKLGLPVTGLMCVPPAGVNPAPHFALLHKLARDHGLANLSMGMSEDFETAVRLGATHVRIGRALFGARISWNRLRDSGDDVTGSLPACGFPAA